MNNIVIADDHPLFRAALKVSLNDMNIECDIVETATFDEALTAIQSKTTDLVLLDLNMPGNESLLGLMTLRMQFPELAVVIVSASEDPEVIRNIKDMGASGFIPKSSHPDEIKQSLVSILNGNLVFPALENVEKNDVTQKLKLLTPQQLRVLQYISQGALNKQIAYYLEIKETTVKTHISDIFKKLEINNRTQAALLVQDLCPAD